MNRKFGFGLFMLIAGSSALGAIAATTCVINHVKTSKKNEETVTANEFFARIKALKIVMQRAEEGAYANVSDKDAAIKNDFEFYVITLLNKD